MPSPQEIAAIAKLTQDVGSRVTKGGSVQGGQSEIGVEDLLRSLQLLDNNSSDEDFQKGLEALTQLRAQAAGLSASGDDVSCVGQKRNIHPTTKGTVRKRDEQILQQVHKDVDQQNKNTDKLSDTKDDSLAMQIIASKKGKAPAKVKKAETVEKELTGQAKKLREAVDRAKASKEGKGISEKERDILSEVTGEDTKKSVSEAARKSVTHKPIEERLAEPLLGSAPDIMATPPATSPATSPATPSATPSATPPATPPATPEGFPTSRSQIKDALDFVNKRSKSAETKLIIGNIVAGLLSTMSGAGGVGQQSSNFLDKAAQYISDISANRRDTVLGGILREYMDTRGEIRDNQSSWIEAHPPTIEISDLTSPTGRRRVVDEATKARLLGKVRDSYDNDIRQVRGTLNLRERRGASLGLDTKV